MSRFVRISFGFFLLTGSVVCPAADTFELAVRPLIGEYCITCHSTEQQEGELDLEQFASTALVKQSASVWERVLEQLANGEMPPESARQMPPDQKQRLTDGVRQMLDEVALENAGDPGPVVLRRLSNQEFTYTLRDLTGVPELDPAREFPRDGAAGEGFTNTGAALVMSPALLTRYLDAAREVSRRMVLLPHGIRFSSSDSPQDWTDEALTRIRDFYSRHTIVVDLEKDVGGTGRVKSEGGGVELTHYLDALQGRRSQEGLNTKYLNVLREALTSSAPSVLLDPLRKKFRDKQLTAADIEPWQQVLWRFTTVGHIGKANGPGAWQEPVAPLAARQDLRVRLSDGQDQTLYLVTSDAGDGHEGDDVMWENPRLISKGRPDIPAARIPELVRYLEAQRAKFIDETETCLNAIAEGHDQADSECLAAWRDYLGYGVMAKLEPLLSGRLERTPDYSFIRGWTGDNALSVIANSSDATVRVPGIMQARSVAAHPSPDRAAVIAWRNRESGRFQITGNIVHAHPECGNGVTWTVEIRRSHVTDVLAGGVSDGQRVISFGPVDDVLLEAGQVIALVIGPRDGNHVCDLTTVNLTITDGMQTWDLAKDVSPDILFGNPHGPWHFLSQPTSADAARELPEPIAAWRRAPTPDRAAEVRRFLEGNFPLSSPLLTTAMRRFRPSSSETTHTAPDTGYLSITAKAPSVIELRIPGDLAQNTEFAVTGRLASDTEGSVQMHVQTESPSAVPELVAGEAKSMQRKIMWSDNQLVTQHSVPIIVNEGSAARKRMEAALDEFRSLFPIAMCYTRIVPVDEVVTLTLYYREDDHLRRLMLNDEQASELDRLWEELRFVSELPLKQVDAFEQLWQYATQDADPSAFEPLRGPILQAAEEFRRQQLAADSAQRMAVAEFASRAWRRPLTESETTSLMQFTPRVMLVRVLASPSFLYRLEKASDQSGPVSDWELASRLSYFLWSTAPDEELRALAEAGRLSDSAVLAAQARRMLQDDRIHRLAEEFGCQWLQVRDVATLDEKSERHFPEFVHVRADMQEEVTRFFADLFRNNRSAVSLLDADYTFINDTLARHYGIRFSGSDWQRVDGWREQGRGGILGFAATLAKHSGASRNSAILRGTWVSEVVLGDRIPDPPQGVPVLPEEFPEGLSERQLIERHSSDPNCAGCHRRIDPFGFALEGFDAIGRARPADTRTVLFDGTSVDGMADLREYLSTTRRRDFLRQFSRKLLGYSLGRSIQLSDKPLIDTMVNSGESGVADLVEAIVLSPQFRQIRGRDSE